MKPRNRKSEWTYADLGHAVAHVDGLAGEKISDATRMTATGNSPERCGETLYCT